MVYDIIRSFLIEFILNLMKKLIALFTFVCMFGLQQSVTAQNNSNVSEEQKESYLERHPIYDYNELQLSATDSIPDFESKEQQLKITGTIYKSDGVTPAEGIILYIEQADENGDFDLREKNDKRYAHHRGWVKTDANGRYTIYTFVPGNDRRYNQLSQLFPAIKEPSKPNYNLESFLFDTDPMLTKLCRKKIAKKGDPTRILKPIKKDGLLIVEKNIVLSSNTIASN
jgi:protocatechuate 3,4-dioxygenase beta subunit